MSFTEIDFHSIVTDPQKIINEHPTPSQDELIDIWTTRYNQNFTPTPATPALYGVISDRIKNPRSIALCDADDVLREANACAERSAARALGLGSFTVGICDEGSPRPDYRTLFNSPIEDEAISAFFLEAFKRGLAQPNERHVEITNMFRLLREEGVYTTVATATPAGTEVLTIEFLAQYFPDAFDGIIFTHDPTGTRQTKANAALQLINASQHREGDIRTALIDDIEEHAKLFSDINNARTFIPAQPWNQHVRNTNKISVHEDTFSAAHAASRFLLNM